MVLFFLFPFHVSFLFRPSVRTPPLSPSPIIPLLKSYYFPFSYFPHLCRSFVFVTISRIFRGNKTSLYFGVRPTENRKWTMGLHRDYYSQI